MRNMGNVIFDLDGTLLDTSEGVLESVRYTIKERGYPELSECMLQNFIGPPIQESFQKYCDCDAREAQMAAEMFRIYYKDVALMKAVAYPGVYELCEGLCEKGFKLAIATYKREDYALRILEGFGFDRYCTVMHGADNRNGLTKADIINLCLREMGGECADSVLVGDTPHDARGAENAGIWFIGVTYGFGFKQDEDVELYPNIGIARMPLDVLELLMKYREVNWANMHKNKLTLIT